MEHLFVLCAILIYLVLTSTLTYKEDMSMIIKANREIHLWLG